jgi:hypothetical protein
MRKTGGYNTLRSGDMQAENDCLWRLGSVTLQLHQAAPICLGQRLLHRPSPLARSQISVAIASAPARVQRLFAPFIRFPMRLHVAGIRKCDHFTRVFLLEPLGELSDKSLTKLRGGARGSRHVDHLQDV